MPSPESRLREAVILITRLLRDRALLLGIIDRGLDIRCAHPRQVKPVGRQIFQLISRPRPGPYKSTEKAFRDVWCA